DIKTLPHTGKSLESNSSGLIATLLAIFGLGMLTNRRKKQKN
ncbi:TPA: LPXTG cell wall anchor domain-containing protein, partial [Staphylococcus aureus]|nr:LPXTG cell wall anchor domain-containing protein [Staphylococcus aureus]